MFLVLGLGNPGVKFDHTRHNAGFDVVSGCAAFFQVSLRKRCFRLYRIARVKDYALVQPLTYMNSSGRIAPDFPDIDVSSMIVVCDQMDLPVGSVRIRKGGSSAGHNGLKSVIECFHSSDFIRIYVGTGHPKSGESVVDHVLSKEMDPAYQTGIAKASHALIDLIQGKSLEEVEREYNRRSNL